MRWGIFSDVHSNIEALEAVVEAYREEDIDIYLCLGDVVGYGANPVECIRLTRDIARVVIAGNHDWAVAGLCSSEYFNEWAREAVTWTQKRIGLSERRFLSSLRLVYEEEDLILVHGSLQNPEEFDYVIDSAHALRNFALIQKQVCFLGHTHRAGVFVQHRSGEVDYRSVDRIVLRDDCRYIVDVGSVGQPRDGDYRAGFCIYDTEKKEVLIRRVDYDVESAQRRILACGLPRFLAARLSEGR